MLTPACSQGFTENDRRFVQRCRRGMSAGLLAYFGLNGVFMHWHPEGWSGYLLAGCAGTCFFAALLLFACMVARMRDEFGRALLLQSLLAGLVGTMFVVFVWGFVELFARTPVAHVPLLFVPAMLVGFTAIAKLVVFRRHRVSLDAQSA